MYIHTYILHSNNDTATNIKNEIQLRKTHKAQPSS